MVVLMPRLSDIAWNASVLVEGRVEIARNDYVPKQDAIMTRQEACEMGSANAMTETPIAPVCK